MTTINETIASAVAENISKNINNDGMFSIEMEMDNVLVYIDGSFEISGYAEDDYFNGTGAWVINYVLVSIDSVEAYDKEGEKVDIACDLSTIRRYAENELAA